MKPEDDLMDALLREQARNRDADEQLLKDIEAGIDAEKSRSRGRMPVWLPLSAAAAVVLGGAWWYYGGGNRGDAEIAYHEVKPASAPESAQVGTSAKALSENVELAKREDRIRDAVAGDVAPAEEMAREVDEGALLADMVEEVKDAADIGSESLNPAGMPLVERSEVLTEPEEIPAATPVAPEPAAPEDDALEIKGSVFGGREHDSRSANSVPSRVQPMVKRKLVPGQVGRPHMPHPPFIEPPVIQPPVDGGGGGGGFDRERYDQLIDQPWKSSLEEPLSTFSIDVDTASYTNLRRAIREGRSIQPDAVRIEECINYFDYRYAAPEGDRPFATHTALATCPWAPDHLLARVAIKGREVEMNARPASNLVFLIDVSGSMQSPDKLQLLKQSMKKLVKQLDERDRVGIVVYAGTEGVALPPTLLDEDGKKLALSAISKLESGGSTNGGAGIKRAYQMALNHKRDGGVNRVILATDGDFNVGTTGQGELVDMVKQRAAKGVFLTVLGFGTGNLNDAMMESISNDGNGNYYYIDSDREAKRVLMNKLSGTLVTIAKDVKIQIEFNPGKVKAYRLIGYANRMLRNQDFNNDKIDAGEIGAGHTVTAFYEIVPQGVAMPDTGDVDALRYQRKPAPEKPEVELVESDDWLTLKLRYKHPEGDKSKLIEKPVQGEPVAVTEADKDFQMAAAVAMFGMKLRNFDELDDFSWKQIAKIGRPALADDPTEQRSEFIKMLEGMDD